MSYSSQFLTKKSRNKCSSCSTCQESTIGRQTTQFKVTCPSNIGDMCIHSRMTVQCKAKFFTECLKWIWALPIVVEVDRLWRCLIILEVTSTCFVLLLSSLGMFVIAQALWSHIHGWIEWSCSDILSGGADICNCKSSANDWWMIVWVNNGRQRHSMHDVKHWPNNWSMRNAWVCWSKGRTMIRWWDVLCTISQIIWKQMQDSISKSNVSMETVNKDRMTIASNAEENSSKASTDMLPMLRERNRSKTTFRRAVSLLWPGQYADWQALLRLWELRKEEAWDKTCFSSILAIKHKLKTER